MNRLQNLKGSVIMFDGPDGVGKTTQFELVKSLLDKEGLAVFATHMLGGTEIGEQLRKVMFSKAARPSSTNFYLGLAIYAALAERVTKERAKGSIVLIDRSPLSLIAYQVYGDKYDKNAGFEACRQALDTFRPDLVVIYDAPFEVLQTRRREQLKHKTSDYFEAQQTDYHKRTSEGYKVAAKHFRATVIDASVTIEAVQRATQQTLENLA